MELCFKPRLRFCLKNPEKGLLQIKRTETLSQTLAKALPLHTRKGQHPFQTLTMKF